jgi:hypothetical protein
MSTVQQIDTSTLASLSGQNTSNVTLSDISTKVDAVITTIDNGIDVNLPLTSATSALQTTGNTSLTSIDTKLTNNATTTLQTTGNTSLASLDTKATTTNTTLNDILLELRDDKNFSETIWYDKNTTVFFVRRLELNMDTGVYTLAWQNPDGTTASPTIANLVQASNVKDIEIVTNKYTANTAGTGYAVSDLIEENRLINTADNTVTTIWYNKTQNTTIATAPTFTHLSQVDNVVVIGKTQYIKSIGNSSIAQLASGATFTGTVQDVLAYPELILSIRSDQPITIQVLQYIDQAGTQLVGTSSFSRLANQTFNQPIKLNGNYARVTVQNTGAGATTNLIIDTYLGSMQVIPSELTNLGNYKSSIEEGATLSLTGTPLTAVGNLIGNTDVRQYNQLQFQLSGTWAGSVQVQASIDGTNFETAPITKMNGTGQESLTSGATKNVTGNGIYRVPLNYSVIRIAVAGYSSGTVNCSALLKVLPTANDTLSTDPIHRSTGANTTSGSITTGGTGQVLSATNSQRKAFEIQNTSAGILRLMISNATIATSSNGFSVPAGGSYSFPSMVSTTQQISVWGATTGQTYTFIEY